MLPRGVGGGDGGGSHPSVASTYSRTGPGSVEPSRSPRTRVRVGFARVPVAATYHSGPPADSPSRRDSSSTVVVSQALIVRSEAVAPSVEPHAANVNMTVRGPVWRASSIRPDHFGTPSRQIRIPYMATDRAGRQNERPGSTVAENEHSP